LACDTFNLICRARLGHDLAAQRISAAIDYFAREKRPFSWWVGPADQPADLGQRLLEAGLRREDSELAMAADLRQLTLAEPWPDGLRIERVQTPAQLRDFAQVVAANWTPPDPLVLRFYELAAPLLLSPQSPCWFYVGYLGDTPVATAELTVSGEVVGLYSVCTLDGYRRRGFGGALTRQPLVDAWAAGYTVAVLQASAEGASVYGRLGFALFGEINEYKPAA
ncbi:MAG TPA: GNAT family N-acetyltransferase, partial [Caldilineaceae bacterium]|nr:GNAT family N-acetyltransferase [Caldilineaceae bacterium]